MTNFELKRFNICAMDCDLHEIVIKGVLKPVANNVLEAIRYGMGRETDFYNNLVKYAAINNACKHTETAFEREMLEHINNVFFREIVIDVQRYIIELAPFFGKEKANLNAQTFYPGNQSKVDSLVRLALSYLVDILYPEQD